MLVCVCIYVHTSVWVPTEARRPPHFLELESPAGGCELPDVGIGNQNLASTRAPHDPNPKPSL